MIFSHDTELSLLAVVDFVNTDPACDGTEGLQTADDVRAFAVRHQISDVRDEDCADLEALRAVRSKLRAIFLLEVVEDVAAAVNALLAEAPVLPRLTDHDGHGWHVHYYAPRATLAQHLESDGAMALAQVVMADETDRLGICDAPGCEAVLVDLTRNRSKRYCDARTCGNRLNVAAYRARKRDRRTATRAAG